MPLPYNAFSTFLKKKFAAFSIRKIPIDANLPCPNKNGTISTEGCIFCDTYGSGPIKHQGLTIEAQIRSFINTRTDLRYIAYYQAHANTTAPTPVLKELYYKIFEFKEIIGLFIGTRPDAIANDVFPLLAELNKKTYLTMELGLQSIHEKSLEWLNRHHTFPQFVTTFEKLKENNIDVVVHLIIGIPGETRADMLATIDTMNRLKPAGIKFHLLHVLKNTTLFDLYKNKKIRLLEKEEYIELMIYLLERLDREIVIHRLTGERDREIFHAPAWALDKNSVIQAIQTEMMTRKTFQGRCVLGG